MPSQFDLYRVRGNELNDDFFNVRFRNIDARLTALETGFFDLDAIADSLVSRGIDLITVQLNEAVADIEQQIADVDALAQQIEQTVQDLEDQIDDILNSGNFPAANVSVEAITNLAATNAQAAFAELQGDIDGIIADVAQIETDLGNLADTVNTKAPLNSPNFSGNPTAPTQAPGNSSTRIATTAFVQNAVQGKASASRQILGGGLVQGGGDLNQDRTLTVTEASQAEAQGGTDGSTAMTPRRTKDYVDARIASQAEAEAGSDNTKLMTPLRVAQAMAGITNAFRNKIINGDGRINQRAASSGIANDEYAHDRHYALIQSGTLTVSTLTNPATGISHMFRLTQPNSTAKRMGYAQILEAADTYGLRGKTVTLGGNIRYSSSAAIRFAILEHTATPDNVTSNVVNSWTNSTYTAGQFFKSGLTVAAVGSITPSANTITDFELTATISSNADNVIVFIWTEGTASQNTTLDFRWFLVEGDANGEWPERSTAQELALCQRYFESGIAGLRQRSQWGTSYYVPFKVSKRITPTLFITDVITAENLSGGSCTATQRGTEVFEAGADWTNTEEYRAFVYSWSADAEL
jgi:hypothetical protein